jgi:hypothetical protein
MNTSETPALHPGLNATHLLLLLACGAVSGCTLVPGEEGHAQE